MRSSSSPATTGARTLKIAYDSRLMHEPALALLDRIKPGTDGSTRDDYESKMGPAPASDWRNLSDLDQLVTALLASGRAESAVALLEKASAAEHAPWDMADRIATLRLHLGEPARARSAWENAVDVATTRRYAKRGSERPTWRKTIMNRRGSITGWLSRPSRICSRHFTAWPCSKPDAGDAAAAFALAKKAVTSAPNEASRAAARLIASRVARFARPVIELAAGV